MSRRRPRSALFPYTTLFRSLHWEAMFTRSSFQTADMDAQHTLLNEVAAMVDAGTIRTTQGKNLGRSEEHTSELQSRFDLVCRLLLEKKKKQECARAMEPIAG